MSNRKEALLQKINLQESSGLEIGPLCWPLVAKSEANIKYVDLVSTPELKKIYLDDEGVAPDLIVEVDYPLNGRTLHETVGKTVKFDYIIASHVIEHVPDMVRWFKDLSAVLKVGGIVSLAIPDKRFTFDIDRNTSTPGDVIGAYLDKFVRPTSVTLFDYASRYRLNVDAKKAWEGELYMDSRAPHRYSLQQALDLCLENKEHYVDTHCFVFTPYSFFEVIRALVQLGLFDFEVASFFPTKEGEYEFLVSLRKVSANTKKQQRLQSLPKLSHDLSSREFEAKITQLETLVNKLESTLENTKIELHHVLTSRSWKLTKPVRYGVRTAKKSKRK